MSRFVPGIELKMRLLVLLSDLPANAEVELALSAAGFSVRNGRSILECSRLAENERYDGIFIDPRGLDYAELHDFIERLRLRHIQILLFVRAEHFSLSERHGLQLAGVDAVLGNEYLDEATLLFRYLIGIGRNAQPITQPEHSHIASASAVEMDLIERTVRRDGRVISLRPKEVQILELSVCPHIKTVAAMPGVSWMIRASWPLPSDCRPQFQFSKSLETPRPSLKPLLR